MTQAQNIPVWDEIGATPPPGDPQTNETIVIVGAGPVGLAMALDLGRRGHEVVVLNRLDFIAAGSKAICFSKRSLEIFDRLTVGDTMVNKGVTWNVGKVFWGDRDDPIYQFDMLPLKDQKRPGFINIQQYHVEQILLGHVSQLTNVHVRWGHEVVALDTMENGAKVTVNTASDSYLIDADWIIACDGSRSSIREMMALDFTGRAFEDNFLIADVRMKGDRPSERWFWFDPPFNPGQSALLHKQPDDIWRLDFQLGPDVDREACVTPENVEPFVRAMLGEDAEFEKEWYSVYTFQCRRMERFVHGRVLFAGDSAHLVSPFGARGCNGGLADVDNLGWKLDLVIKGAAPETLLETYNYEGTVTADENILNSTRSTDFLTPRSQISRAFRDAILELSAEHQFARPFVNSGRLSTSVHYPESPLNTADVDDWGGGIEPGSPALDAPVEDKWLLGDWLGNWFVLLADGWVGEPPNDVELIDLAGADADVLKARYDLAPGSAYLFRPDQYVAARWRHPTKALVSEALCRATGAGA